MSSKEILEQILSHLKISANKLSKELGHPSNVKIYHIKSGRNNISVDIAKEIEKTFPEFNYNWILKGEGEMLKNISKNEVKPVPYENYMEVEYAKLSTSAGKLGFENPATLPSTRKKLIPREFDNGNYLVVEVDGDSMDDGTNISIPDGADILIKEYHLNNGDKLPIRGNLFVIVTTEGTVFKQITEHNTEEGYLICHSYNPKYKDYKINMTDVLQIFIYRKIVSSRPSIPEI